MPLRVMYLSKTNSWLLAITFLVVVIVVISIARLDINIARVSLSKEDAQKTGSFIENLCVEDELNKHATIAWRAFEWEYINIFQRIRVIKENDFIIIKPQKKEVITSLYIDGKEKLGGYGYVNDLIIIDNIDFHNMIVLKTTEHTYNVKKCSK